MDKKVGYDSNDDNVPSQKIESKEHVTRKRLILIRHAESTNNVAKGDAKEAWSNLVDFKSLPTWKQLGSTVSLISIPMNTDLSTRGELMAQRLQGRLAETGFVSNAGIELVLHSHLIRAARTCTIAFGQTGMCLI
jgi:broad specificity phosphatase PhoE